MYLKQYSEAGHFGIILQGGPKVDIQYTYYILHTVYLLLAHLVFACIFGVM